MRWSLVSEIDQGEILLKKLQNVEQQVGHWKVRLNIPVRSQPLVLGGGVLPDSEGILVLLSLIDADKDIIFLFCKLEDWGLRRVGFSQ